MQPRSRFWIRFIIAVAVLITAPIALLGVRGVRPGPGAPQAEHPNGPAPASISSAIFGQLPLAFEINEGQAPEGVRFVARTPGGNVFLTDTGVVFAFRQGTEPSQATSLRMNLKGAGSRPPRGMEELSGRANYFIGNDPSRWRKGIAMYRQVKCTDVYPGIDLVYYGNQRQLEYDLVIRPGGDPGAIRWVIEGADTVELAPGGELVLAVGGNKIRQQPPRVYQQIGKERREVQGAYLLASAREIGFQLGEYDRAHPVLIDPVLIFSTFVGGGTQDYGRGIAVDSSGAYITGATFSTNFPTAAPRQTAPGGNFDAFVLKLNPTGSALIYATYLGGGGADYASAIAVDGSGNAYVTGWTTSSNFPTANPRQPTGHSTQDAFVMKLSPTGSSLVYSTYLGGNDDDFGRAIAVDGSGAAYVAGSTQSTDFPTASAYQGTNRGTVDAFVSKLNPSGSAFAYSTYLGGALVDEIWGIALDTTGAAYLVGTTTSNDFPVASAFRATRAGSSDAFVTKFSSSGSLAYSTYLGGTGQDFGYGIAVDASGSAVAVGQTLSTDFPVFPLAAPTPAFQQSNSGGSDAFVTKLSPAGSALIYSTFLGGTASEKAFGVALDGSGNAFVTGETSSTNFPVVGSLQTAAGDVDVFVVQLNALGSALIYSTYLGGANEDSGRAIALDSAGNAYVTGQTQSTNLPTTASALQTTLGGGMDAFVAKVGPSTTVLVSSIGPATGPTAGGTSIVLRGANFNVGATVTIGGVAAISVVVTSAGTISATTPAHAAGTVDVVVTNPDSQSSTLSGGFIYADPPGSGNNAGSGKGCGSAGAPVGIWLGAATILRRYLRGRRRSAQSR